MIVTATNASGSTPATSAATGTVTAPPAPSNTAAPAISGQTVQGQTLSTTNGSWNGSPTSYAYQWQDCSGSCSNISGATHTTYTLAGSDVGDTVRVIVTATNASGSTPATSAATGTVTAPPAPSNTAAPAISGQTVQGQTLSTTNGSWNESPTSYAYQWQDCSGSCSNISGATSSTYALQSSDVGDTIDVVVTATNANGSTPATSAATSTVTASGGGGAGAPSSSVGPYFTTYTLSGSTPSSCSNGCAVVGETLGVSTGTWSNSPTSYTYQWDRCATTSAQPPTTGSCTAIAGATSPTYTVQSADSGHSLVPIVTATNASGSASTNITSGSCDTGEMLGETEGSAYATTSAVPTAQPAGCSPISAVVATTAAAETFCTNAVTTCGYADPLNHTVGVPAGVTPSTTGACASNTNGGSISSGTVTINGCLITGQLNITGGNVTIENSELELNDESGAGAPINIRGGTVTAKYDTINGLSQMDNGSMAWAIYDCCGSPAATVDHVFVYNVDRILMNLAESSQTPVVSNSYCWSNAQIVFNGSNEHAECIYTQPPSSISVQNTTLLNWRDQTAANYVDDNTGSCCGTVNLANNLLGGGDYTFYGGGPQVNSETYLNNRITRAIYSTAGLYGPGDYNASASGGTGFTQTGNIWDDTGTTANP